MHDDVLAPLATTLPPSPRPPSCSAASGDARWLVRSLLFTLLASWPACTRTAAPPDPERVATPAYNPATPADTRRGAAPLAKQPTRASPGHQAAAGARPRWSQQWLGFDGSHELWLRSRQLGATVEFDAMWTDQGRGEPLDAARVTVLSTCGGARRIRAVDDDHPGHFRWSGPVAPRCELVVRAFTAAGASAVRVDLSRATAYPGDDRPGFRMTKAAQWAASVQTAAVTERWLRAAKPAAVTMEANADGRVVFTAPNAGIIGRSATGAWPQAHVQVARDAALLTLALDHPRPLRGLPEVWLPTDRRRRQLDRPVAQIHLRAPRLSSVERLWVHPGQRVAAGAPVLSIVDDAELVLRISMSAQERRALGDKPQLLLLPDRRAAVAVSMAGLHGDPAHEGHLLIPLHDPSHRWRAGERVPAAIEAGPAALHTALPAAAALRAGEEMVVFVQRGGDRFERRIVTPAFWSGDAWAVKTGLSPGDRVVVAGAEAVRQAQSDARARAAPLSK